MGVKITNIEYYLPKKVVTNDQLAEQFLGWSSDKIEKKVRHKKNTYRKII